MSAHVEATLILAKRGLWRGGRRKRTGHIRLSGGLETLGLLLLLVELRHRERLAAERHRRRLLLLLHHLRLGLHAATELRALAEHRVRLEGAGLLRRLLLLLLHLERVHRRRLHRLLRWHAHVWRHWLKGGHALLHRLLARNLNVVQGSVLVIGRVRVRLVHLVQVLNVDRLLGHVAAGTSSVVHADVGLLRLSERGALEISEAVVLFLRSGVEVKSVKAGACGLLLSVEGE